MLKHYLVDKNGTPINVQTGVDGNQCLVTDGSRTLLAQWQAHSITTATTTTIATAKPSQSIMLTDLVIILSKKVAAATIIPLFTDGTNSINFATFDGSVDSFYFTYAFTGGVRGWKDADFKITTNEATTLSVILGYVHISPAQTLPYGEWDAAR
jgi:hypothetical protein